MRKHILIAITAFLAGSANAQVTKGTNFISANGGLSLSLPEKETVTSDYIPNQVYTRENSAFAYSGAVSYNHFFKDNLALGMGVFANYNETKYNNQVIQNDTNYATNDSKADSRTSGLMLTAYRFLPVWKDRIFVSFNGELSGGLIEAESEDSYFSDYTYEPYTRVNNYKVGGVSTKLSAGIGAWFFINKHWVLSTSVTAFNVSFQHYTTTRIRIVNGFGDDEYMKTKSESNRFDAALNPFVQPFSLTWGLSYFF